MQVSGKANLRTFANQRINAIRYQLSNNEYPKWLIEKFTEAAWKLTAAFIKQHSQELTNDASITNLIQLQRELANRLKHVYARTLKLNNILNTALQLKLQSSFKEIEL